jgi:Ca-activated chloride channel family protein
MPNRLMHTGSRPALLAAVVTAALSLGTGAEVAAADTAPDPSAGAMNLVLDSSGSMAEPAAGGVSKIEAARTALRQVVTGLPDGSRVGMRVYGATVNSGPHACQDSQSVVPVGPLDRAALTAAVARYTPRARRRSASHFARPRRTCPERGTRTIVLVSDGEANCAPRAVRRRQGARRGGDRHAHRCRGAAAERCRPPPDAVHRRRGRGTYYDAADAQSIVSSISRLSCGGAAVQRLREAVKGMDTPEVAPDIAPGQYTDTLGGRGDTKYYRIPRSAGSVIHAAVTPAAEVRGHDGLSIELETPEGGKCGSENHSPVRRPGQHSVMSVTVRQRDRLVVRPVPRGRRTDPQGRPRAPGHQLRAEGGLGAHRAPVLEEPRVLNEAELPLPVDDARTPACRPRCTGHREPVAAAPPSPTRRP